MRPESLRITPKELKGLRVDFGDRSAAEHAIDARRAVPALAQLAAYAFTQGAGEPDRRWGAPRPYIEARQLLAANIESGVVKYDAWFFFDIRYQRREESADRSFRRRSPRHSQPHADDARAGLAGRAAAGAAGAGGLRRLATDGRRRNCSAASRCT